ncbi:hypothetical protein Prudu_008354 [Prunus dulcis]|uniref:Uncharacterized protein n=1 Tax=Prunus dulcis TaxID=3755 RepID=A0A4Y1R3X8_PRUDU|nr:hypothetical protein Prudu_008354 [Prunus dulcis]
MKLHWPICKSSHAGMRLVLGSTLHSSSNPPPHPEVLITQRIKIHIYMGHNDASLIAIQEFSYPTKR